jgi:putative transposase
MKYEPQYHNRTSNRLKGYDYTQAGAYFITICTYERECLFGKIEDSRMILNENGIIAYIEWLKTCEWRKYVELDVFVIMPNHIHGIIVITQNDESCRGVLHTPCREIVNPADKITQKEEEIILMGVFNTPLQSPSKTIGAIIRGYKSSVTKNVNQLKHNNGYRVWQRNFHDHIIRDNASYVSISNYIVNNPANWQDDVLFK